MPPLDIVPRLDVLGAGQMRLAPRAEVGVGAKLVLQRGEEALADGIVPAIALATHAWSAAGPREHVPVLRTRVLRPTIRVLNESGVRTPHPERLVEGRERERRRHRRPG